MSKNEGGKFQVPISQNLGKNIATHRSKNMGLGPNDHNGGILKKVCNEVQNRQWKPKKQTNS